MRRIPLISLECKIKAQMIKKVAFFSVSLVYEGKNNQTLILLSCFCLTSSTFLRWWLLGQTPGPPTPGTQIR